MSGFDFSFRTIEGGAWPSRVKPTDPATTAAVDQAPGGSPSQMVGFTEYAAQTSGAQTVHVYVENAIQAAGNVTHA